MKDNERKKQVGTNLEKSTIIHVANLYDFILFKN